MWVNVCKTGIGEQVRRMIPLAGNYIIVPFSNSHAHRIANKYSCNVFYVENVEALIELLEELKKHVRGNYDIVEINDIRWYPSITDDIEVLVDNEKFYIEWYATEITDGYYAKHKHAKIEVNITNLPF